MEKTYTAAELANEWDLTPEAVRKYLRRILADEELSRMDLVRIAGHRQLVTEAGRAWIDRARSGSPPAELIEKEEPAPLPENSEAAELMAKLQEQADTINELQRQAIQDQMQIGFLETRLQDQEQNSKKTEMLLRTELEDWKQQAQQSALLALNAQRLIETHPKEEQPATPSKTQSEHMKTDPEDNTEPVEIEEKRQPGKLARIWRIIIGQE